MVLITTCDNVVYVLLVSYVIVFLDEANKSGIIRKCLQVTARCWAQPAV